VEIRNLMQAAVNIFLKSPVSIISILLSYIGTVLIFLDPDELWFARWFLFQTVEYGWFSPVSEGILQGQFWRVLSPIFLHYSLSHVMVGTSFFWLIVKPIERNKGSWHFLLFLVISASITNTTQYLVNPDQQFGGLVCLIYSAVGYITAYQMFNKNNVFTRHRSTIVLLLIVLFMGVFGVFDIFISSGINHRTILLGLIVGAVYGFFMAQVDRRKTLNSPENVDTL